MNIENLNLKVNDSVFERIEKFIDAKEILNPRTIKHKILIDKFKEDDLKSQFTVAIILFFNSVENRREQKKSPKVLDENFGFAMDIFKKCADKNHNISAFIYANYLTKNIPEKARYLKIAIKSNPDDIQSKEELLKLYYKNMNEEQNPVSNQEYEQILLDLVKLELKLKDSSKFDYGENPYMMRYLDTFIFQSYQMFTFSPYSPYKDVTDKQFNQARDLLIEYATVFKDEYASVLANLYFFGLSGYLVANKNEALKWAKISKADYGLPDFADPYGEYLYTANFIIADIYLETGKKREAQSIYEEIICSIADIIDHKDIYSDWTQNDEFRDYFNDWNEEYFDAIDLFDTALLNLASLLDLSEEKINCLSNTLLYNFNFQAIYELLEIAIAEFQRKHKILNREVITNDVKNMILNVLGETQNRPQLPEGYNKVLNLLGKNLNFLEYFVSIGTGNTNVLTFPKDKIARQIHTSIEESKISEMADKVASIVEEKVKPILEENINIRLQLKKFEERFNKSSKVKRITQDESSKIEFKTSVWTPYPEFPKKEGNFYFLGKEKFSGERQVYNFIKNQTLKAIIAFLNSNGGEVVIGIHEKDHKKEYVGIQYDLRNTNKFKSKDSYIQFIYSQINNYILPSACKDFINVEILKEDHVELCIVKVKKLPKKHQPARLLDNKEEKIYIRNGNATEEIVGNKLIRYYERLRR